MNMDKEDENDAIEDARDSEDEALHMELMRRLRYNKSYSLGEILAIVGDEERL